MSFISNLKTLSLINSKDLLSQLPLPAASQIFIKETRENIQNILTHQDSRLLVIVGPCSIHDIKAANEYAFLLKYAAEQFADELFIVMRTYFEKPRTTLGWKGFINDPTLDNSFNINLGLKLSRQLLLDLTQLKIPVATEFLDPIISHYLSDVVSWGCIGARTSESQIHRALVSGLPMPVGFKNTTDGNIQIAIDAVNVAKHPHAFLGVNETGQASIIQTPGNNHCHIVLRGSHSKPNYSAKHITATKLALLNAGLLPRFLIDCSHGNSMKNYLRQQKVVDSISKQIREKSDAICGVMLESHLKSGKQTSKNQQLIYGQSITDACLSWEETVPLLAKLAWAVKKKSR